MVASDRKAWALANAIGLGLFLAAAAITLATASKADELDRHIEFVNGTGTELTYVYASPSTSDYWGTRDYLGSSVVESGTSKIINIDDGSGACVYDINAIFSDGDEVKSWKVDVCNEYQLAYSEE